MRRNVILLILLIGIAGSWSCLGDCYKKYTLVGTVADPSLAPLYGVEIRWYYVDPKEPIIVITTTDPQGNYSYSYSTRSTLHGDQIEFVKAGYNTVVAEPYNISEGGPNVCGSITVRRDAIMHPQ